MIKGITKRFFSLFLTVCMIMTLLPSMSMSVLAETVSVSGLSIENLEATYEKGNWSGIGNSMTGSATGEAGCSSSKTKSILTLKNNYDSEAKLFFSYTVTKNEGDNTAKGKVQVDGEITQEVNVTNSFEKTLAAGASIKIIIETAEGEHTTAVKLENISLVIDRSATTVFKPSENGSYTVDGAVITQEETRIQQTTLPYSLAATPAEGYKFVGWYNETIQEYISYETNTSLRVANEMQTITAKFVSESTALYQVDKKLYTDLNEANNAALSSRSKTIILYNSGIFSGSAEISSEVIFLIPFDESNKLYTTSPNVIYPGTLPTSPYRKLTMAEGSSITVNGAISVGGELLAANGGANSNVSTGFGAIEMKEGSTISISGGANLYAWGYIYGSGSVYVASGAHVYEFFQIEDFRGGGATSNIISKMFPFSQYYVQNVEVEMTLASGASETVTAGLHASKQIVSTSIDFIGPNGMFKPVSGTISKKYLPAEDRMVFTINGEAEVNSLTLNVMGTTVNSINYVLPITNNISLNIESGKVTVNQDLSLLPGVKIHVADGAELVAGSGKKVVVYDNDQWDNFAMSARFKKIPFSPSRSYNRTNKDLVDARVDVNGTVTAEGGIYTTEGGADICSSEGTGSYYQKGAPGSASTIKEYKNNNTEVDVSIEAAKLHNADGSYTETSIAHTGDIIDYVNGKWGGTEVTATFYANDGTDTSTIQELTVSTDTALTANTFTREGYSFSGWNTAADGSGTAYEDGATVNLTDNIVLYAQWTPDALYTVEWVNDDGTVLETDENVPAGTMPEFNSEKPVKSGNEQYSYTFIGWTPEVTEVTGNVTYKATYIETVNTYTITWLNEDGEVLDTDSVEYGQVPQYQGEIPEKEGNDEFSYSFGGWTPAITAVTGDATYQITYTPERNAYTVIWEDEDGTVLETDENVEYGSTPEYNGTEPVKEGDAQYSYTFGGWAPAVDTVTGDITYTATYIRTVNKYYITWKNYDGSEFYTESVEYGTTPVYSGNTPEKEGNAQYSYTFSGWTPEILPVTADAEYTADFAETENTFTVTWYNDDGTVLETDENVPYNTVPEFNGEIPTKVPTPEYTYEFAGWNTELVPVTEDAAYYAQYNTTRIEYNVTWLDYDDKVLENDSMYYRDWPSYSGGTPSREDTVEARYEFLRWEPELKEVTEDAVYKAVYKEIPRIYHTITYEANGGHGSMGIQTIEEGVDAQIWMNEYDREDYIFTGWNTEPDGTGTDYGEVSSVIDLNHDLVLYAQWKLMKGWVTDDIGTTYYLGGEVAYHNEWAEVDGNTYFFNDNGYIVKGLNLLPVQAGEGSARFVFDNETGIFRKDVTGLYENGQDTYWVNEGQVEEEAGLKRVVKDDGEVNYYYFAVEKNVEENPNLEISKAVKNLLPADKKDCWIHKTNDLALPEWGYYFDEEGVILHDEDTSKNGILREDGVLYYYIDGVKAPAGLIEIDGDYYYANSSGKLIVDQTYYVSRTNGLLDEGTYEFDEDGRIVLKDPNKNGIIAENGSLYYYVEGNLTYAGLIEIDGDYYYVRSNCEVVHGQTYYVSYTRGLKEAGYYTFDDDGRMIETKNGFVEEDGTLYYYKNGAKNYAGLIEVDGDYYYVNSSSVVVCGRDYWVSKTNGLMPEGSYTFQEDGKMVVPVVDNTKDGIVEEDGSLYYYKDGVRNYAGLIEIDGEYYYVRSNCEVVHGRSYYVSWTHGLMEAGNYEFADDGKMMIAE